MGIKIERDFKEQEKERKRPLKLEVGKRELTTKKSFFFFHFITLFTRIIKYYVFQTRLLVRMT